MPSLSMLIATGFGAGLIPPVRHVFFMRPGTYGTFFAGMPIAVLGLIIDRAMPLIGFGITSMAFLVMMLGLLTVEQAEIDLGERIDWRGRSKNRDQGQIVIDEVLGITITVAPLALLRVDPDLLNLSVAFLAFRIFDTIGKRIPPMKQFDQWKSAAGVMLDDAAAGAYAAVVVICLEMIRRSF